MNFMNKQYVFEKIFKLILLFFTLITILSIFCILIFLFKEMSHLFQDDQFSFSNFFYLEGYERYLWSPNSELPQFNILPLIVGSLKITFIALMFALPLAFFSAIFTSQFCNKRTRFFIKGIFEFLSNIPSVVLAFLGLLLFADVLNYIFQYQFRLNGFLGGLTLGLAIFPTVYTLYEDILWKIPKSYTEASLSLGANMSQTILKIIFPYALPGFFVASILGFNRAIGETMIVLMLSGNTAITSMNFFDPLRTISATIASEMGEVIFGEKHYAILFFLGLLLFSFTFFINVFVNFLMRKFVKSFYIGTR